MSLDIEKMFADAANAAEDTGEKDPSGKVKEVVKVQAKPEPEPKPTPKPEPKPTPRPEPVFQPKQEPKPIIRSNGQFSVEDIDKVLGMNEVFSGYNKTERSFILRYFECENDSISQVIYKALTANRRELEALNNIVVARNHDAAERAFYLMDLSTGDIASVYDQVDLLTGELGEDINITDNNKISVCRSIEKVISSMDNGVFLDINKLQDFTNKAI